MEEPVYLPFRSGVEQKRWAIRRRLALTDAGCSTYTLEMRQGYACILCLCCGHGSVNASDIMQRFCGFCGAYHTEDVDATPSEISG